MTDVTQIDCVEHGRDVAAVICAHYRADLPNARSIAGSHIIFGPYLYAHCAACEKNRASGGEIETGGLVCRHCLIDILDPAPGALS